MTVLGQTSPLRAEVVAFANGAERVKCPGLLRLCARLRFIVTHERYIEGSHAALHKDLAKAPHCNAPFVALSTALPEIQRRLRADPDFLLTLAEQCALVTNPYDAVRHLDLECHPVVTELCGKYSTSQLNRVCKRTLQESFFVPCGLLGVGGLLWLLFE